MVSELVSTRRAHRLRPVPGPEREEARRAGLLRAQDPELHGLVVPLFDRVRPVLDRASL